MSKIYKKNDSFVNLKLTNNNNDISKAQIIEIIKKSISLFNKPADLKILNQIILDFSDKDNFKEKFDI